MTLSRGLKAIKHSLYFCTIQCCLLINILGIVHSMKFQSLHKHKPTHTISVFLLHLGCRQSVIFFSFQQKFYKVLPWLRRLVAVLLPINSGFGSSSVCVCVIYGGKKRVGVVSYRVLWLYPIDIIPPIFRTLSTIHHQHHEKVILAAAGISNT